MVSCPGHRLCSIADIELGKDVRQMAFHRADGDDQLVGDIGI
jgi:hypothetical protein